MAGHPYKSVHLHHGLYRGEVQLQGKRYRTARCSTAKVAALLRDVILYKLQIDNAPLQVGLTDDQKRWVLSVNLSQLLQLIKSEEAAVAGLRDAAGGDWVPAPPEDEEDYYEPEQHRNEYDNETQPVQTRNNGSPALPRNHEQALDALLSAAASAATALDIPWQAWAPGLPEGPLRAHQAEPSANGYLQGEIVQHRDERLRLVKNMSKEQLRAALLEAYAIMDDMAARLHAVESQLTDKAHHLGSELAVGDAALAAERARSRQLHMQLQAAGIEPVVPLPPPNLSPALGLSRCMPGGTRSLAAPTNSCEQGPTKAPERAQRFLGDTGGPSARAESACLSNRHPAAVHTSHSDHHNEAAEIAGRQCSPKSGTSTGQFPTNRTDKHGAAAALLAALPVIATHTAPRTKHRRKPRSTAHPTPILDFLPAETLPLYHQALQRNSVPPYSSVMAPKSTPTPSFAPYTHTLAAPQHASQQTQPIHAPLSAPCHRATENAIINMLQQAHNMPGLPNSQNGAQDASLMQRWSDKGLYTPALSALAPLLSLHAKPSRHREGPSAAALDTWGPSEGARTFEGAAHRAPPMFERHSQALAAFGRGRAELPGPSGAPSRGPSRSNDHHSISSGNGYTSSDRQGAAQLPAEATGGCAVQPTRSEISEGGTLLGKSSIQQRSISGVAATAVIGPMDRAGSVEQTVSVRDGMLPVVSSPPQPSASFVLPAAKSLDLGPYKGPLKWAPEQGPEQGPAEPQAEMVENGLHMEMHAAQGVQLVQPKLAVVRVPQQQSDVAAKSPVAIGGDRGAFKAYSNVNSPRTIAPSFQAEQIKGHQAPNVISLQVECTMQNVNPPGAAVDDAECDVPDAKRAKVTC